MVWPINYLIAVLVCGAAAVIAPWLLPQAWRKFVVAPMVAAFSATIVWWLYEQHLGTVAIPGDPLIRIDLFLIVPLIALDWLSAVAVVAWTHLRAAHSS